MSHPAADLSNRVGLLLLLLVDETNKPTKSVSPTVFSLLSLPRKLQMKRQRLEHEQLGGEEPILPLFSHSGLYIHSPGLGIKILLKKAC